MAEARDNVISECIFTLVGTKSDLPREVDYEEGIAFMKANNLDIFFETSSKTGENVAALFESTAKELIEKSVVIRAVREQQQVDMRLQLEATDRPRPGGCC